MAFRPVIVTETVPPDFLRSGKIIWEQRERQLIVLDPHRSTLQL